MFPPLFLMIKLIREEINEILLCKFYDYMITEVFPPNYIAIPYGS